MRVDLNNLPFRQEVFVCGHLARDERPLAYVFLSEDASLSMLCDQPDDCDVDDVNNCKVACLGHMIERNPDLRLLRSLPRSTEAWRDGGKGWILTATDRENNT